MARITKHKGKKRGPKKGSKHSHKHNNAIAEGMKKYWATKGKRRKNTKGKRKSFMSGIASGKRKPKTEAKRFVRYLNKRR